MSTKKASDESGGLKKSPVVMIWRRVSDLDRAKSLGTKLLEWRSVGEDRSATMYDAGSVLVNYWVPDEAAAKANGSDSASNRAGYTLVSNPASEFVLVPARFQTSVRKIKAEHKGPAQALKTEAGDTISFVDDDGNFTAFYRPSSPAFNGKAGMKLNALLAQQSRQGGRGARARTRNQIVAHNLLVSDLKRSREFYQQVLGLRTLQATKYELKFDVGTLILSIKQESAVGLVGSLKRAERLLGDRIIFHVADIEAATEALARRGVEFPGGIEKSVHGPRAYFNDPDGHSLMLWQPSDESNGIDYSPVLHRILKNAT
ncbi:MAG TPA: VOC family protein [Pyrinomonadaceae bacterium]|jgi:predicted enzyme related to lactoylglutathione lyase|nr:VOC family protein [Pyrinomonadaceae bacterium]